MSAIEYTLFEHVAQLFSGDILPINMKIRDGHIVKRVPGKGIGLFAAIDYKPGDFIIEYVGKPISTELADTLTTRYLFDLENGTTIDGSPRHNTARYINHSCDPNCEVEADQKQNRLFIMACEPIKAGEELSIDYGDEYYKEFIVDNGCRCPAVEHRNIHLDIPND
jgi:uncharacterized protein